MKQNVRNLIENFRCDYTLIRIGNIKLRQKLSFLITKYITLPSLLFRKRIRKYNLFEYKYMTDSGLGILGFQVMLKDFYHYYKLPIKDRPVIFDVGANIGNFSICATILHPTADIYAFEPVRKTFSILGVNCANYRNIHCYDYALGDKEGNLTLYVSKDESDRSSFNKGNIESDNIASEVVRKTTLDNFIAKNKIGKIDVMKIDVEGFEYEAVLGCKESLDKCLFLIIEFHIKDFPEKSSKLIEQLLNNDFMLYSIGKVWKSDKEVTVVDLIFKNQGAVK